ncbi:hypothetical protein ACFQ3S_11070 [Mucilaginibacter terrae]|uniref:hypothetical protein n=1 Tax=Mucilaginibacter terrae TaxID=1955052 RepID=UPI0036418124
MKNTTQPATSKLVKRFDNELMHLIAADLKAFKAKGQFVSKATLVKTAIAA